MVEYEIRDSPPKGDESAQQEWCDAAEQLALDGYTVIAATGGVVIFGRSIAADDQKDTELHCIDCELYSEPYSCHHDNSTTRPGNPFCESGQVR